MLRLPQTVRPWGLMLLMLAAATALRGALDPVLGDRAPFVTYYPLTVLVALYAGSWPAAASMALSVVLSGLLFGVADPTRADVATLAIYVPASAVLIVLIERGRRAGDAARQRERAALERETATAAQRAVLEAALESVDAGVHSWNPEIGVAQWDARLRRLFGFGPNEPEMHSALLDRIRPADRARVERAVADAMSPNGPRRYSVEFRIERGDGETRWISSAGFAVFEGDRLVRVVSTGRDVTERRRVVAALRDSEHRFATLAEGSPVLLWVNGAEGGEFVNRSYREFVGVDSDEEISGDDWSRFVHPEDRTDYSNAYQRAAAMQVQFTAEFRFRRWDGEYRWMRSEATPRYDDDGELVGYVGAMVDITERRKAEDALRVADRQKHEFLAMLAQELRSPEAAVPISMLRRQSDHVGRLLDDLLDFTRIAQGRIVLKQVPLELGTLVAQAIEAVGPLAQAKSQLLSVECQEARHYVSGDRTRLLQSLTNLLQNSVKFTRVGGGIVVAVRDAGSDIEVTVRDDGVGIAPELMPRVFDLFVQSERTPDRLQGGSEIGLSALKRLVEMHGGALAVAREGLGRGTTVTIRLPRIDPPAIVARPPRATSAALRVLVVDDSTDAADSLAMLLELEGHEVSTAYGAAAALEQAERLQPEIAFIHIGLPQMDGYEVAQRLRASERCRTIRLVALTGCGQPGDCERARRAGFDHHLLKPADLEAVDAILAEPPGKLAPRTGSGAAALDGGA